MYRSLTPNEKKVIIDKGTEYPGTGELLNESRTGIYCCRQCRQPLYFSSHKFDSHCGRPSFDDAIPGAITMISDSDGIRTEIVCRNCDGHLGHIFHGEQSTAKNVRHCVNSISMIFVQEKDITDDIRDRIPRYETMIVGGGCFWCIEGPLSIVPGVIEIQSGYAGGKRPFPTYERICAGVSGYVEAVRVFFDPQKVSYQTLLEYFFAIHDPTSMDQQGNDKGSQYRSVIWTQSPVQQTIAESVINEVSHDYPQPIVTEIREPETFYLAEGYHQQYYANNPSKPYCQMIVKPKKEKLEAILAKKIEKDRK